MITYTEAVAYILEIPKFSKIKTSTEDLKVFLKALGNPEQGKKVIHVAGTNGKGSVCAFLTSILIEGNKSVGTFTSPHLEEINERFAINRTPIDNEDFLNGFIKVSEVSENLQKKGYHGPTFFEFLFLMAMVIFYEKSVDYIVLETGLGGRLDATNVIEHPLVSIITSISLDHMEVLGHTIGAIAKEKAGIIKSGVPVVYDASQPEAAEVIVQAAKEKETPAFPVNSRDFQILSKDDDSLVFSMFTMSAEKRILQIPFVGDYQVMNGMLAVRAIELMENNHGISWDMISGGLKKAIWPGRMEQVLSGVYLDGAHNPGAVKAFIKTAKEIAGEKTGKIYLLFSSVGDKDYRAMAREICSHLDVEAIMLTQLDNYRGLSLDILEQTFSELVEKKIFSFKNVEGALDAVLQKKTINDKVFCVGSLYLVGAIKAVLRRKYNA